VHRRILDPAHDKENENWRILTNKETYVMVKKTTITENKVKLVMLVWASTENGIK